MAELINKLILKKLAVRCEFIQFDYANYFVNYYLSMFITPKQLKLAAGGGLIGELFDNLLEGYRTPLPIKITQNPPIQKPIKQGGARKALLL